MTIVYVERKCFVKVTMCQWIWRSFCALYWSYHFFSSASSLAMLAALRNAQPITNKSWLIPRNGRSLLKSTRRTLYCKYKTIARILSYHILKESNRVSKSSSKTMKSKRTRKFSVRGISDRFTNLSTNKTLTIRSLLKCLTKQSWRLISSILWMKSLFCMI